MEMTIFCVDSTVPASEMEEVVFQGSEGWELHSMEEYKYLSALPLGDDGSYVPVCSKDAKKWVICFGAEVNGCQVDIRQMAKDLEDRGNVK